MCDVYAFGVKYNFAKVLLSDVFVNASLDSASALKMFQLYPWVLQANTGPWAGSMDGTNKSISCIYPKIGTASYCFFRKLGGSTSARRYDFD